ncbi:hypothetical protein PV325_003143 [Microctonus aethiopoides]|nr:hypothetical protein PV325_003143 [Microctonus aethiopoides]
MKYKRSRGVSVTSKTKISRSSSSSSSSQSSTDTTVATMTNMFPQQYCLRWKYHHSNLQTMFSQLLERQAYCDVTLACEGQTLRAHKERGRRRRRRWGIKGEIL